jgi:hypothetical protein
LPVPSGTYFTLKILTVSIYIIAFNVILLQRYRISTGSGSLVDPSDITNINHKSSIAKTITTSNDSVANSIKSRINSGTSLLGCDDIAGLEIVRVLGEGKKKTTFEVKLPSGEHAVAKRCNSYDC